MAPEAVSKVIASAIAAGARGLVCSAHPAMHKALDFMRAQNYSNEFGIYLIVPDMQSFVQSASTKGMTGLIGDTFGNLTLKDKTKAIAKAGLSAVTFDPQRLLRTYLDIEVASFASSFPSNAKLKSVFIHEILTELMISFEMRKFAQGYVAFVREKIRVVPGFATRNFPRFIEFMRMSGIPLSEIAILTPFNRAGFQMNPSRKSCEDALLGAGDANVIAMSILAGGYLDLDSAIAYIRGLPVVTSCVVGVSTPSHATETFSELQASLVR